ncbi:stage V sporulation protein D [Fervidicella metallireducens]|nr:stage V sporulation protein D [Fervidicella metallireducens]
MSSNQKTNMLVKKRVVYMLLIILAVQFVIMLRYAWVQIVWSPQLQKWAVEQWTNDTKIDAKRGKILDRNGSPLAVSGNVERVDAFMKDINEAVKNKKITKEEIAEKLSPIIGMTKEAILKKLNKRLPNGLPLSSVTIIRRIEKEQGNKIRELKLPGIVITEDTKRYYPNGNFLAHVLGNTNIDGDGRAGIELQYNEELKGTPGRFMGETDAYHREMPYSMANYVAPKNGNDIVLTIDQSIQYFVEKQLERGLVEYKAKQISAIVMDPKTGEILAMANKPDYDPNNPVTGDVSESIKKWRNRAVNDVFEPGSVLKVITAAAAIEENIVSDEDRFVCHGSKKVADRIIHCWKRTGHGTQNFAQILQNSCNVGFMELGERLGKEKLYKYWNLFGFGKKTNIDFPGEENGIIRPIERVNKVELVNQAFGQGISVTMIQYLTALAAVANDGKMMQPHLLKQVLYTDENGNTSIVKEYKPKVLKQVMSAESARKLRAILETVVSVGAGKKAYLEGYHVGGKTGTAQKVINGVYANGKYISSFASMAPCSNPEFVIILSIDEPDPSNYYSGSTAAPLTKQIIEDIFRYRNIPPDATANKEAVREVVIPEIRGLTVEEANKILRNNKLNFETQGNGSIIYDVSPTPGVTVRENTKITLYLGMDKNKNEKVAVPNFTGMTKKEINELAKSLGIKVSYLGDGIGVSQSLQPGTEIDKSTEIEIILEQPED